MLSMALFSLLASGQFHEGESLLSISISEQNSVDVGHIKPTSLIFANYARLEGWPKDQHETLAS